MVNELEWSCQPWNGKPSQVTRRERMDMEEAPEITQISVPEPLFCLPEVSAMQSRYNMLLYSPSAPASIWMMLAILEQGIKHLLFKAYRAPWQLQREWFTLSSVCSLDILCSWHSEDFWPTHAKKHCGEQKSSWTESLNEKEISTWLQQPSNMKNHPKVRYVSHQA